MAPMAHDTVLTVVFAVVRAVLYVRSVRIGGSS